MNVGRNPLQVSSLQPQSAMAKLLKRLVSVVLILVSVSVTQISSEKVVRATALTCAEGGTCVVGDIGPGGGIIFYVSRLNFTSTSSNCNTECKYLEVAPSGWNGGSDPLGNLSVGIPLVGSHSVTIGSIVYDDWFLPSIVQLNQLCRWHRNVLPLLDYLYTSVTYGKNYECPGATLPNTGVGASAAGILGGRYLSSSAEGAKVWDQDQSLGYNFYGSNQHSRYIRPVRAFSPGLVVTYNSQSGSAVSAGSTTSGGSVSSSPGSPTRAGYSFSGWFAASTGGSAITFPYSHGQTSDFTLYAQWTISTYAVSFNSNDSTSGSVPVTDPTPDGEDLTLPDEGSLVKTGYTFGGWNTASDGSGTSCAAGAPYRVVADVTLFAKWTANSLTVRYDSQEGSSATGGSLSTTTGGTLASLPTTSREGYAFNGWFTASTGGSEVTTSSPHGQTADFTLYARWTVRTYAVSFNGNDSTGGSVPGLLTKTHGVNLEVASNSGSLVKTGYTFGGWNTAANGSGTSYAVGASYGVDAAVTLYAKWTANSLTVRYDSQEGSSATGGSLSTTTGGTLASLPTTSRVGYTFNGWFTASTGGSAITFPYSHGQTSDFTLYAQWTISTYAVSFNGNGSTGGSVPVDQTKTHGIDVSVSSNTGSLVKTGYTFGGWNTAANGSGTSYAASATYGVDAAVTLYAKWTADSLTVTYNSQSGSAVSAGSTVSGGSITSAPVVPTRAGYVFTGWFTATSGGTAITFPYTHGQTASFTLYAQWSQASLHGISSVSKIGTITTTANVGNTFAVDTESSSVSLRYPANGLPADSVIDVYLVNDLSRARSLIVPAGGFVVSLVVAWLAADGSVPLMASGKPLSMTIANDTIKAGAKTYAIVGGEVTLLATASVNGSVTISITEDPEIVVVNPVVVAQPSSSQPSSSQPSSSQPSSSQPSSSQPSSSLPTAGVKKNPSKATNLLPQIPGATSKIAAILNAVAGQLPPKPTVFAPRVLSNGQIARIAFTPIQIKAPPANAPVAPAGAKVLPIGSKIEQSQATPTAPVSRVAAGESKATFGGQTIETTIEKAANGPALLSAGPATIALAGFVDQPAASNNNSGGSTGLTASSSTPLEIATGSFIASTPVQVWLFSTPLLLAETTVDENGNFAAAINLPSSLASGSHTLQIQGYVYASGGAAEVTANIGISITRKTPKTWSTTFPMFSSAISARQKSTWQKFVADQKSPELSCALTPTSPSSRSAANLQLFNKRMLNVTTFLKLGGCTNITTVASAPLTKNSNINRTWTVAVEPQTTKTTFNWVHVFSLYSSKVRKTATTTWTMNVAAHADKVLACRVTAVEPAKKSRANTKLFDQRNNAISSYLIENSCDTVEFTQSIASKEPFANRQAWTVRVSTSAK